MKIIYQGKPPSNEWRGTCHRCKTIIECENHELHNSHPGDAREGPVGFLPCPVCGRDMHVYPKKE